MSGHGFVNRQSTIEYEESLRRLLLYNVCKALLEKHEDKDMRIAITQDRIMACRDMCTGSERTIAVLFIVGCGPSLCSKAAHIAMSIDGKDMLYPQKQTIMIHAFALVLFHTISRRIACFLCDAIAPIPVRCNAQAAGVGVSVCG